MASSERERRQIRNAASALAVRAARHPPRLLHPRRAASPTASMQASTAGSARRTRPRRSARTAPAWPRPSACRPERLSHRLPDPFAERGRRRRAVACGGAAARRRHRDARRRGSRSAFRTADCGPVLFADPQARVIGAAHAGWRGALTGVLEATVAAMEKLGAKRERIVAAAGPMIRQPNYEVGQDLIDRFLAADPDNARYFAPAARDGHAMFDLPGYCGGPLEARRHRAGRRPRALHLCRSGAVLFLSPHHPSPGAGLRTARQRDCYLTLNFHRFINRFQIAAVDRHGKSRYGSAGTGSGVATRTRQRTVGAVDAVRWCPARVLCAKASVMSVRCRCRGDARGARGRLLLAAGGPVRICQRRCSFQCHGRLRIDRRAAA